VLFRSHPGEPGVAYLKAFELTGRVESALQCARPGRPIPPKVGRQAGINLHESDQGLPHAARFGVRFKPGLSGWRRKVLEWFEKIGGWRR
jgi:hypothetical protein